MLLMVEAEMLSVPPKSKYAIIITNYVAVINQSVTKPSHPTPTLPIDILAKILVKNKQNCMDPQLILRHSKEIIRILIRIRMNNHFYVVLYGIVYNGHM